VSKSYLNCFAFLRIRKSNTGEIITERQLAIVCLTVLGVVALVTGHNTEFLSLVAGFIGGVIVSQALKRRRE